MTLAKTALFPKAVLLELALGIDNDADIALRHKLDPADIAWVRGNPAYAAEIAKLSTEMRDSGFTFKRKNAVVSEDILPMLYLRARDPNIGAGTLLDIYRTTAKFGELEPKENTLGVGGGNGGFQINIVVNGKSLTAQPEVFDHAPTQYSAPTFDTGFLEAAVLNPPSFLDGADLSVNDELIALPLAAS